MFIKLTLGRLWRPDIQQNDTKCNDTRHERLNFDGQLMNRVVVYAAWRNTDSRNFIVMLSVMFCVLSC